MNSENSVRLFFAVFRQNSLCSGNCFGTVSEIITVLTYVPENTYHLQLACTYMSVQI